MVSPVISFRVGDDAIAQLRERAKPGESASQTAQRLLNEILGTTKEVGLEMTVVDSRIQTALEVAIAPILERLTVLENATSNSSKVIRLGEKVA